MKIRALSVKSRTVDIVKMSKLLWRNSARVCGIAVLVSAAGLGSAPHALAGDQERHSSLPLHFSGLLNDYTPSAAVVKGGPYEMRGKWSLDLAEKPGAIRFTAAMNMETSDYGIAQGSVNKDDPVTRGAHTHHIEMTDGTLSTDTTGCPTFSPPTMDGFVITGSAFVTGNGGPAPFGNPSSLTICVLGGANVKYSNITLTFGKPANTHFGMQAVHGVILECAGPWLRESNDCTIEESSQD
jgi:hypothetical protein